MKMYLKSKLFVIISVVGICLFVSYKIHLEPNSLLIEVAPPQQPDTYQVFYDVGQGFNETDSVKTATTSGRRFVSVNFFEVPFSQIRAFRIDPGRRADKVVIKSIRVQHEFHRLNFRFSLYEWEGNELATAFAPVHQSSDFIVKTDRLLHITSRGMEPALQHVGDLRKVQRAVRQKSLLIRFGLFGLSVILASLVGMGGVLKNSYPRFFVLFLVYASAMTGFLVLWIFSQHILFFKILLLFYTIAIIGMGPALYCRDVFNLQDLFSFLVLSIIAGLLVLNLTILSVGHLGGRIVGVNLRIIMLVLSTTSLSVFVVMAMTTWKNRSFIVKRNFRSLKNFFLKGMTIADVFALASFVYLFVGFALVNAKRYIPAWDHFVFWLLNAKVIFETGKLPTSFECQTILDLFFHRSAYQPLHAVYVYEFLGDIVEQAASYFTILYGLLATLIAYMFTKQKSNSVKILVTLCLLIINLTFLSQQYLMITFYAEVILAFYFVFFFFLLSRKTSREDYPVRIFCLVITVFIISIIKSQREIGYILIGIWCIHDFFSLKTNVRGLVKNPRFYFCLAMLACIYGARWYYLNVSLQSFISTESSSFVSSMKFVKRSFLGYYAWGWEIVDCWMTAYYHIPFMFAGGLVVFWCHRKDRKDYVFKALLVGSIALFLLLPIGFYLLKWTSLESRSLLRYSTYIFYCLPLLFTFASSSSKQISPRWPANVGGWILSLFVMLTLGGGTIEIYNLVASYRLHSGKYIQNRGLKNYYDLARKIKTIAGDNSVLICDSMDSNVIGNMGIPAIYTRYFLYPNSVGGQYRIHRFTSEKLYKFIRNADAEYVLIQKLNDKLGGMLKISEEKLPVLLKVLPTEPISFSRVELKE